MTAFPPEAEEAFRVLENALLLSEGFKLFVVVCDSFKDQSRILGRLYRSHRYRRADVDRVDASIFDQVVEQVGPAQTPMMVVGLDRLAFRGEESVMALQNLNITRPLWVEQFERPVVFWVSRETEFLLSRYAPDFYRFRSATIEFDFPEATKRARIGELRRRLWSIDASPKSRLKWEWELWRLTNSILDVSSAVETSITNGLEFPPDHKNEIKEVILRGYRVGDESIERLSELTSIRRLWLGSTAVTREGLIALNTLKELRELHVFVNPSHLQEEYRDQWLWTDSSIEGLYHFEKLDDLSIEGQRVTDNCFKPLSSLKSIRALSIDKCDVTGIGLTQFEGSENLRTLNLSQSSATDDSLMFLESMASLRSLGLGRNAIRGTGLRFLSPRSKLRKLWLTGSAIDDEGMAYVSQIDSLERLSLFGTGVTPDGLMLLGRLQKLRELFIDRTLLHEDALMKLKQAVPQCSIKFHR